ncbi:MAG: hypothetical protein RLZZ01_265 [Actinomycetota bacterium]|jgi:hypothetical protein
MKMIGNTAVRCGYGCCRATPPSGRGAERRWIKRSERNAWKRDIRGDAEK